jgi:hypothetical protein
MSYQTKTKLLFGNKSKYTYFGKKGCAKGMYSGGFNWYVYGIKGLIAITRYEAWGDMIRNNPNLE